MDRDSLLALVEATLDEVLPRPEGMAADLFEAMRYAVGTGGKRIRPLICLASSVAAGGAAEDARYPAAAIELLHNYTLVHDDLPAMDNDVERRGKPTVWKKFGEANAILAGDALLALAYRVAAKAPRNVAAVVDVLGEMGVGVVMGQVEDIRLAQGAAGMDGGSGTPEPLPMEAVDFVSRRPWRSSATSRSAWGLRSSTKTTCSTATDFAPQTRRGGSSTRRRQRPSPRSTDSPATPRSCATSPVPSWAVRYDETATRRQSHE